MPSLNLLKCPFLGPAPDPSGATNYELPADYASQPFKYLPKRITLSEAELDLAQRYEKGDFSGGYGTSQICYFRRGVTARHHQQRHEAFRRLNAEVARRDLVLPKAFVELVESDDYINRLRHNTIWLTLPDELVPLPCNPDYTLFLAFGEGQGCGYWHLLLGPDGSHVMAFASHPFGLRGIYPEGSRFDVATVEVYQCAESFAEWIVLYFADCIEEDRGYESKLKKYWGS